MGSVYLIRHGQASWGAEVYDQLSEIGENQARALGTSWEASGWAPSTFVIGGMQRHAQTAVGIIDACGQGEGYDVDGRWDEYDHEAIAKVRDPLAHASQDSFQGVLQLAVQDWRSGVGTYEESYEQFRDRVMSAFDEAVTLAGPGSSVAIVTSGGPIGMVVSHVLVGDDSLFWGFNNVIINAGVTTITVGRSGTRLLSFNEHTHLPRDLVTFR